MTRRPWTAAEVRDALRWYAGGMRVADIAAALDRTASAVLHKVQERGMRRERRPVRVMEEDAAAARATLRAEIAAARAERDSVAPFKPGALEW
jgi:hypothetical protein